MYNCAAGERSIGAVCCGISAPFCTSSSAIGKGMGLGGGCLAVLIGENPGDVEPGMAGSAAARARKTACVFRDRSVALTLALNAIP